ncbi:hypothetical protein [Kordiimonas aestuarii]|uniref:hypothetical protein n=1 Tax=Kordiimonas aestuarii TaxID=1005925 RepID=UPI0021D3E3BA|nr:hypothetical protein [Kordiimonas aestuarii]
MKGRISRYFVVASFVLSVIIVAALGFVGVHASEDDGEEKTSQPDGPLVVPIYPKLKSESEDKAPKLPDGADFRDSYIVLEDGSVMSVADWILGSLTKNDTGADMSDYQNRLFLGQVARSMVGLNEDLVNRSFVHTGPPVPYTEGNPLPVPLEILKGLKNMLFPKMPKNWSPATSGGGFSRNRWQEGHAAILFERQMSEAMERNAGELWESGTMQNMLKEYKKRTPGVNLGQAQQSTAGDATDSPEN